MRWLVVLVLVLCGCGAKHETAQPASGGDDANPDATVNERITATELEQSDDPEEDTEEEPDEQEEDEEPEEEEEDEQEETEEQDEPEVRAPAPDFNYEEWTAEPPTLGQPKVPGPPYPYLEAGGKKELFDRLRRYRWLVWEHEQTIDMEEAWIENWEQWEKEGHPVRLTPMICRSGKLRENDQTLKNLFRKYEPRDKTRPRYTDLARKLPVYGGRAADLWFRGIIAVFYQRYGRDRIGGTYHPGALTRKKTNISDRKKQLINRLGRAADCWSTCPSPDIHLTRKCAAWKNTFMED